MHSSCIHHASRPGTHALFLVLGSIASDRRRWLPRALTRARASAKEHASSDRCAEHAVLRLLGGVGWGGRFAVASGGAAACGATASAVMVLGLLALALAVWTGPRHLRDLRLRARRLPLRGAYVSAAAQRCRGAGREGCSEAGREGCSGAGRGGSRGACRGAAARRAAECGRDLEATGRQEPREVGRVVRQGQGQARSAAVRTARMAHL